MKNSEFAQIKGQHQFKDGFKGALSFIIAGIIDWYTKKDVDGNYVRSKETIDQWDWLRVNFAYSLKGQDGNVNKYVDDLRPLFPVLEDSPFTLTDGKCDSDEVESELITRISAGGYFNYWAGAKPEHKGKMFVNNEWV